MVGDGVLYRPPQVRALDAAAKDNKAKRLAGELRALGFEVKLERAASRQPTVPVASFFQSKG